MKKFAPGLKKLGINDIDGRIVYAKSLDLKFSQEDCEALTKEAGLDKKDELNEEELKKVAGGFVSVTSAAVTLGSETVVATTQPGW
jgi:hypothetical protein